MPSVRYLALFGFLLVVTLAAACQSSDPTSTSAAPATAMVSPTATPGRTGVAPTLAPTSAPHPTSTPTESGTGLLEVRVTDKPAPAISAINLVVENIEVHNAGAGEWEVAVGGPTTFDLIAVKGIEELLGASALPVGRYTQVRLNITAATIVEDGAEIEATVPSDVLRIVGTFSIAEGATTIATLDFDAEQSIVRQGQRGFLLRPVVKLLVRDGDEPFRPQPQNTSIPERTPTPAATARVTPTSTPAPPPASPTADSVGEFFLSIESPDRGEAVVAEPSLTIVGRTRIDATVSVNDIFADVDEDGRFQVPVQLEEGPNIIEVVTSISTGETLSEIIVVIYSP